MTSTRRRRRALLAALGCASLALAAAACTDDVGSEEAFCDRVATVPPLATLLTGFDDADPAELSRRLDSASSAYDDLRDAAPQEIRDDVGEVVRLVQAVIDAVEADADDPEAAADRLRAAMADHRGGEAAALEVAAYASDRCGVELNPTVDDGRTTTDGGAVTSTSTTVPATTTTLDG
ncbi:MAG TPA: hypothetical protein VHK88_02150 [Aquihabitans sp.]|nr:hypothetical protein [Aquihabitans sp.]